MEGNHETLVTSGPDNADFAHFWTGLEQGVLRMARCADCRNAMWYPKPRCPRCHSDRVEWAEATLPGQLFSFTVVRHPFSDDRVGALPYVVGLVEFEEPRGVRLVCELAVAPQRLRIGMDLVPEIYALDQSSQAAAVRFVETDEKGHASARNDISVPEAREG